MKKLLLICFVFTFIFAAQRTEVDIEFTPKPAPQYDVPTTPSVPLIEQMTQAKLSGDMALYEQLLQEYEKLAPRTEIDPRAYTETVNPEDYPILRFGDDITIYAGDVYWNSWAQPLDIDDEAISIDYHLGDTVIAAVACADSLVRAFKSYDNGLTWNYVRWFSYSGAQLSEPEIIWGGGGYYHVFMRVSSGNGNLLNFNVVSDESDYNVTMIENTSDSVHNYTVCSDKADYTSSMWLYCAWHVGDGGVGADDIDFTRSYDDGENWDAPTGLQGMGAGWPDLTYGESGMVYEAFYGRSGGDHDILVNRSTNLGDDWTGAQFLASDTYDKQGPQIAASHSGDDDIWVVWPRKWSADPYDYDLWFSWSTDVGANWSSPAWASSFVDDSEILPSVAVYGSYGSDAHYPYLTYARVLYDLTGDVEVHMRAWDSGGNIFGNYEDYSDNPSELTRPIQTFDSDAGTPAFAYVGDNGVNVYWDGWMNVGVEEQNDGLSVSNQLSGTVQPNPFTSMTSIAYTLPSTERMTAKVYNTLGQTVSTLIDGIQQRGKHEIQWNAADLPKGVYFLKFETENAAVTKKVIIE